MTALETHLPGLRPHFTGSVTQGPDPLHRVPLSLRRPDGRRIRGLLTCPASPPRGVIVALAGLGRTVRHTTALALAAGHHGYATLRFDPTHHVGDSDGEIIDATLSSVTDDLLFVCNSVRRAGWRDDLFVVAASTFARCAIKTIRYDLPANGMVLTLPVVVFDKTLQAVAGEDLIGAYRSHRIRVTEPVQILSHEISARFLEDAINGEFCGIHTTRAEFAHSSIPIAIIAAEGDEWVDVEDLTAALEPIGPNRKLFILENADHDSYSFGFIRAITQTTMQVLSNMTGCAAHANYEVTFSKLTAAVRTEKSILSRARYMWSVGDE